jgi:lysophospholipase L1-like esterase
MRKLYYVFLSYLILNSVSHAQVFYDVDFGSANLTEASLGHINNISRSFSGGRTNEVRLITSDGQPTQISIAITDDFTNRNSTGSDFPDYTLGYTVNQTSDSFFGNALPWNGNTNATGQFEIRGLDTSKLYSFDLFASRMNVSDNRETSFTVTGASSPQTILLAASNNETQSVQVLNISPDVNGVITIDVTAGPNNTNSSKFFYINALQMQEHDAAISQWNRSAELELVYPVNNSTVEEGKTIDVIWNSKHIRDVDIEYSTDGGINWQLHDVVDATIQHDRFIVPQGVNNLRFRVSGNGITDSSQDIQVIPDDGIAYDIYVLGSSTAAGSGPSHPYNAWVNKYSSYLEQLDTRFEVTNLAVGGQVTYNLLPDGTTIPAGVNETINSNGNVTAAISNNADGIIINLPSNDAARGYSVADQLQNYQTIIAAASAANIPVLITTPQPRFFGGNSGALTIQQNLLTATWQNYPNTTVDFWTGFPVAGDNGLLQEFDSGDGVHANNEAHQIFFERMLAAGIHTDVKQRVDQALSNPAFAKAQLSIYPNPTTTNINVAGITDQIQVNIYDLSGRLLKELITDGQINVEDLNAGTYLLVTENIQLKFIKI